MVESERSLRNEDGNRCDAIVKSRPEAPDGAVSPGGGERGAPTG